jgi:hypothetical protein
VSGRPPRLRALRSGQAGQAAVELVALTPIVCALAVALGAALLAGAAGIAAEHAVGRGVAAAAAGADPVRAARGGLPRALVPHSRVRVRAGVLEVLVDVPGPAPAQRARLPLVPRPVAAAP